MKKKTIVLMCMAVAIAMTSCEKPIVEEEAEAAAKELVPTADANVVIRVTDFILTPNDDARQTRAVEDITAYSTRFNFVIYKDGKKLEARSQMKGDDNYGQVAISLEPGTYKLLVLAHSSNGGNPTLSDPENLRFTNSLSYSDTFYYYDNLVVTSEPQIHNVVLKRASARLSFTITDEIPSNVKNFSFYYTGGSGVLNAVTGYAADVNSQQTMLFGPRTAPTTFDIYTFLKQDEGKIQLSVTALDADGKVVKERQFDDVPMKINMVTQYSGSFFDHASENGFTFTAETGWTVYETVDY